MLRLIGIENKHLEHFTSSATQVGVPVEVIAFVAELLDAEEMATHLLLGQVKMAAETLAQYAVQFPYLSKTNGQLHSIQSPFPS